MAAKTKLKDIRILLADSDSNLGIVLTNVLQRMGFKHIQFVRDGASAIKALQEERKDILITEWQMQSVDGIELTNFIRNSDDPAIRLLPIIMLTARAEKQDVEAARDAGITEFVVKPYNSRTIFQRIQQVIDNPRGFLIAPQYTGPDRRRRDADAIGGPERRKQPPEIVNDIHAAGVAEDKPKLILPDYMLKKRIGSDEPLDSIITPHLLSEAQQVIDDLKDESLHWIKKYLDEADSHFRLLNKVPAKDTIEKLKDTLLAIKSNAGTFGYTPASEVAHQLYQFMRYDYSMSDMRHSQVLLKHLQSLKILLGTTVKGKALEKENQLLAGLKTMVSRFQKKRVF